jgi:hypothetical protein
MGAGTYHERHHVLLGGHQGEQLERIARKVTYWGSRNQGQRVR